MSVSVQTRVIGGAETAPLAYTFIASLHFQRGHSCGSTIIDPDWAMTAAHCVTDDDGTRRGKQVNPQSLSLLVYENDLTNVNNPSTPCSGFVDVAEVVRHPDYKTDTLENDIALLRLAARRPPECLETLPSLDVEPSVAVTGTMATVAGWGRTSPEGISSQTYPNKMYEVSIPIVSRDECARA